MRQRRHQDELLQKGRASQPSAQNDPASGHAFGAAVTLRYAFSDSNRSLPNAAARQQSCSAIGDLEGMLAQCREFGDNLYHCRKMEAKLTRRR